MRYIKINTSKNDEIIDLFLDYQLNKFDGSEIEFDSNDSEGHKINSKSLSNEDGVYIFTWNGSIAVEKSASAISDDVDFIADFKQYLKAKIQKVIGDNQLDILESGRTMAQVVTRWTAFKADGATMTTRAELVVHYNNAIDYLNLPSSFHIS